MRLYELHIEGGILFMGVLFILLLSVLVLTAKKAIILFGNSDQPEESLRKGVNEIVQVGLFALVFGIFGQCLGLYSAFVAIQEMGDVSPALLAGGLKVSMITTLYGFFIFLLSYISWFVLKLKAAKKLTNI